MMFAVVVSAVVLIAIPLKTAGQLLEPSSRSGMSRSRGRSEEPVNDHQIQMKIIQEGVHLIAEGKTVPRSALLLQLTRQTCRLTLPKPRSSKMSREALAARSRSAVLIVARLHRAANSDDWMAVPATGFFISGTGVLVTSRHVVTGTDYLTIVVMTGDGRVVPVTQVLAADEAHDVVLLQADIRDAPALPLQTEAEVGASVCLMSHPMGRFFTFTEGVICRRSLQIEGAATRELLDVSADFGPGSSGAPLLDLQGNVVGWADQLRVRSTGGNSGNDGSPVLVFRECGVAADILRLIRR
jgi:S1-C subfamily serine protease